MEVDNEAWREDEAFLSILENASIPEAEMRMSPHDSFEQTLFVGCGAKKRRHRLQESSLIQNIPHLESTKQFVEFGAGTATLSFHTSMIVEESSMFHLLDRQTFRSRIRTDYRIRQEGNCETNRITKDVVDLDVAELHLDPTKRCCWISKHFCGVAFDLMLERFPRNANVSLCAAPCCHNLIDSDRFFGDTEWLETELGLSVKSLAKVSGWATLGDSDSGDRLRRKKLGKRAKSALNWARARRVGGVVVQYTEMSVENQLIIVE